MTYEERIAAIRAGMAEQDSRLERAICALEAEGEQLVSLPNASFEDIEAAVEQFRREGRPAPLARGVRV